MPPTRPHKEPEELNLAQSGTQELTPTQQLPPSDTEEELTPTQRLTQSDTEEELDAEEELAPTQQLTQSDTQPDTQPATSTSVLGAALPPRMAGSMTLRSKPKKKTLGSG